MAAGRGRTFGQGRTLGAVVAVLCLAVQAWAPEPVVELRRHLFDAYQRLVPPLAADVPVAVVAVDEGSLKAHGQWPWPRTVLAALIDAVAADGAAAIGIDILMPEPDRFSPAAVLERDGAALPEAARRALAALPSHDERLAAALARAPVVVGIAGVPDGGSASPPGPLPPVLVKGSDPAALLPVYGHVLRSVRVVDRAASGHGLLSVARDGDGTVRRLPLVAMAEGRPALGLAAEMVRVATGVAAAELVVAPHGIAALRVGPLTLPVDGDGSLAVRYAAQSPGPVVTAAAVLAGQVPTGTFAGRLVLVGVTGLGLVERPRTPMGEMNGVEIHARMIATLLGGEPPRRPSWAGLAEAAAMLALALALIGLMPRVAPRRFVVLVVGAVAPLPPLGPAAFAGRGWQIAVASPAIGAAVVFVTMLATVLAEAQRQKQALVRALEREHLEAAFLAGELEAERRAAADRMQFIDMVSHEYRTPLAVLRANLNVVEMRTADPELGTPIARMRRAVERLVEIVDVGLVRAKADGAGMPAAPVPLPLHDCLSKAVRLAQGHHPRRRIAVDVAEGDLRLMADPPLLSTALLNLLDNALKYSGDGTAVTVSVTATATALRIAVADQGIGIAAADRERVFEKFYRAPQAAGTPGTGMGLGIARRIVELHGGTLALDSEAGRGTTVTVTLPRLTGEGES
ncbi:MAG: CHASE2 domain-containing protein [Magnetospirillum sp.]|nr:CHASE2 domain-containing protein [Magnetospirillum sp.]